MKKSVWLRVFILMIILIAVAILFFIFIFPKLNISGKVINQNIEPIKITKENFPAYLQKQGIIKELPNNAVLLFKFYNSYSGEWQWEESYVLKKGSVQEGTVENPDIIIMLDSKYLPELGDFCSAAKKAKANNNLFFDTKMSAASLMWKYRSILKYRNCFGV